MNRDINKIKNNNNSSTPEVIYKKISLAEYFKTHEKYLQNTTHIYGIPENYIERQKEYIAVCEDTTKNAIEAKIEQKAHANPSKSKSDILDEMYLSTCKKHETKEYYADSLEEIKKKRYIQQTELIALQVLNTDPENDPKAHNEAKIALIKVRHDQEYLTEIAKDEDED